MNVVVIGRKKFTGPSSWEHLTPKQYLQWVRWHLLGAPDQGWYALLQLWFSMRYRDLRLLDEEKRLTLIDEVFAWMAERPSRWMLPKVWANLQWYRGPGDRLQYLTFGEFMFAESARSAFTDEPTKLQLAELAAALYRPQQRGQQGHRSALNKAKLDKQIERFARLPQALLEGIRINYFGCVDQLPARFDYLYNKQGPSEEGGTWLDVGLNLARQTGALGSFAEMETQNVYLVLIVLNDLLREQAELKANLTSHD